MVREALIVSVALGLCLVAAPASDSSVGRAGTVGERARKRTGLPASATATATGANGELFVQRDGTMLSAGTLSSAPSRRPAQQQPSETELSGMLALFDE
jgi:hypothetical protein|eukprot:COSAG06_NODE_1028_length_11022_cov_3.872379_2_plen_99_part_00